MALTMQDLRLAQDALAQDGREARKAIASLDRRVTALEGRRPSTKVASPEREIRTTKRASKGSKRTAKCRMNGCDRKFFGPKGAYNHNCLA